LERIIYLLTTVFKPTFYSWFNSGNMHLTATEPFRQASASRRHSFCITRLTGVFSSALELDEALELL